MHADDVTTVWDTNACKSMDDERFIVEVKKIPPLYDTRNPFYKENI